MTRQMTGIIENGIIRSLPKDKNEVVIIFLSEIVLDTTLGLQWSHRSIIRISV